MTDEAKLKKAMCAREWRANNRERYLGYYRNYRRKNIAKRRASVRKHYATSKSANWTKVWMRSALTGAKRRAEAKNIPFDITSEDIPVPETCPVLGIPILPGDRTQHDNSPSIDRIIPSLGYVRGNVRVISSRANRIKTDATAEELGKVARYAATEADRVIQARHPLESSPG